MHIHAPLILGVLAGQLDLVRRLNLVRRLINLVRRLLNLVRRRLNLVHLAGENFIVVPSLAEERSQSKDLDQGANQSSFFQYFGLEKLSYE